MWIVSLLGGWRASVFAGLLVLALGALGTQTLRLASAQTALADSQRKVAEATAAAEATARRTEQQLADAAAKAADEYERGKADAQATADRVVSYLRAGNLRLRREWGQCETGRLSDAVAGAAEPDAGAALRAERASRIVRAAAQCDAQIRGLQALIQSDRSLTR